MTTLLQADEVDYLRSIKKAAIILLAMGLIDRRYPGRAVTDVEMAGVLEIDPRTVAKHMISLAQRGRLLFNGIGYVLTDGGRALLLAPQESTENVEALKDLALKSQDQAHPKALSVEHPSAQNMQHTMCALKEEEKDSLTLSFKKDSPPPPEEGAQNVHTSTGSGWPTTAQILAATPILFGEPGVVTNGLGDLELIPPHHALGWVAHAYALRRTPDNPRGLYAPAGLVYSKLRDPNKPKPRASYYVAPMDHLPEAYIEALGLMEYQCDVCRSMEIFKTRAALDAHTKARHPLMFVCEYECGQRFLTCDDLDKHMDSEHRADELAEVDPSVVTVVPGSRWTLEQAWHAVLEQLQMEMPPASFDTWVRDTLPIRYDGNVLTIGARNAYARDWLESRLTSTVNRLLIGILDTNDIHVEFVVSEAEVSGEQ